MAASVLAAAGFFIAKPAAAQVSFSVFGDIDYQATRDNGTMATNIPASNDQRVLGAAARAVPDLDARKARVSR